MTYWTDPLWNNNKLHRLWFIMITFLFLNDCDTILQYQLSVKPNIPNRSRGGSNEHRRSECFCPLGQILAWFTVHLMTRDVLMGPDSPVTVPLFTGQQTLLYQPDSDSRTSDTNKELLLQSVIQSVIQSKSIQSTPHCNRPYITAWWRDCVQHQYSERYLTASYCLRTEVIE